MEFSSWEQIRTRFPDGVQNIVGGGPFGWPSGHATDDTDLTRAVLLAYLSPGTDVVRAAADHMLAWLRGDWPGRQAGVAPRDVGGATRDGLLRYERTGDPRAAGAGAGRAGNGSLMRCIPTALAVADPDRRIRESMQISAVTHDDPRCTVSCAAYNEIVAALLAGAAPGEAVAVGHTTATRLGGTAVADAIGYGRMLRPAMLARTGQTFLADDAAGYVLDSLSLAVAAVLDPRPLPEVVVDIVASATTPTPTPPSPAACSAPATARPRSPRRGAASCSTPTSSPPPPTPSPDVDTRTPVVRSGSRIHPDFILIRSRRNRGGRPRRLRRLTPMMQPRLTRVPVFLAMLVLASTISLAPRPGAADAATAADPNCTGYGVDALVDPHSAGYIYNRTTGTRVGSVQLCQRYNASAGIFVTWVAVTLYYDMSAGQHANGRLLESTGDTRLCSDNGGTGAIIGGTGDRTCATAGLPWLDALFYYSGEAYVYNAAGTIIASGSTGWW